MYRIKDIENVFLHLVGWEQDLNPEKAIKKELTKSESGLFFQSAHPLVTLDNIRAIIPDDWELQYPAWNKLLPYVEGDKVSHNNIIWISKKPNTDIEPNKSDFNADFNSDFGDPYWEEYDYFSDYLEKLTRKGIVKAIQEFVTMKGLAKETKSLLERRTFFDGAGRLNARITNSSKLVGFEIVPLRSMGVTTKIERIGLQMTGSVFGTVKMFLFHSSQSEPIKSYNLNFTKKNGGFQWFDLEDCYLPYTSLENNAGGSWFLCYNQDDLPFGMEAINMSKDWSKEPCGSCGSGNSQAWKEITKYLQISPFAQNAPSTFKDYPYMFDIGTIMHTYTQNYGINVQVSVKCDLTDFFITQRDIFSTVVQKQVAAIALRTMAMNPSVRVNRNQSNVSRMEILYEIDGNTEGRPNGLGYELKNAYKSLSLDTRGIDRICLGCNNYGVRYRSV